MNPATTGLAGVSPIDGTRDQWLYREFLRADWPLASYANSWSYVTQACRGQGCGHKYLGAATLIGIGRHGPGYVLVRPTGEQVPSTVAALAHRLASHSAAPVHLKHVRPDDAAVLVADAGFRPMADHPWSSAVPQDDSTYPDVVVRTTDLVGDALLHPSKSKLRSRLNRFHNTGAAHPPDLTVRLYRRPEDAHDWAKAARSVVTAWSAQHRKPAAAYANMIALVGFPPR
ncbi:hypothetical protein ACFVYR_30055 [Streptomyces sp. NPDC058284]|uniref:hypothetical protein n=1 Tax=unclassified Streptomyces TaxID=2593676 RepID=UPI003656368A